MEVRFIYHSGFIVETDGAYYIFDYYKGPLPLIRADKPVTVFASHHHPDHYAPVVFDILRESGVRDITAVLSHDIFRKRYPEGIDVLTVQPDQSYTLPRGETVRTLRSTDSGVAFLLKTPEITIYHAGDLNDWTWEGESEESNSGMRSAYRRETLKLEGEAIDAAFVVLDPRQEEHYTDGMLFFLSNVKAKRVYPMHYSDNPEVISQFIREYPQYADFVADTEKYKISEE